MAISFELKHSLLKGSFKKLNELRKFRKLKKFMKLQKLRKSQDSQGPSRKVIKAVNNCWRDETLQTSELPLSPAEISKDTAFVSHHPRWTGLYSDAPVSNLSLLFL